MKNGKGHLADSKPATSKWADHVELTENSKQKGIELLFNNELAPELQSKLRAMGFRPSKVKFMWYSDNNPSAKSFALDVQSAIEHSPTGPDLFLSPSFEATRTNIEKKEFSFILISLKGGQIKNYIVFEPSKPKAEVIATQFSRQQFGESFLALAVKPRTQLREARMLLDEGKIIFGTEDNNLHKAPASVLPRAVENIEESSVLETATDNTRELEQTSLQKFYSWAAGKEAFKNKTDIASRNLFNDWLNQNAPELAEPTIENIWRSHERIMNSTNRIQKRSLNDPSMRPYESIYKKLLQIIPDLIKHLEEGTSSGKSIKDPKGGFMDLHYDFLGKDKNGNYLIALSHYFKQNGDSVPDPDMEIRISPEMKIAEAMTFQDQFRYKEVYLDKADGKEYVDLRRKKELNSFLNHWLTNIIQQGHKIDLIHSTKEMESPNEDAVSAPRIKKQSQHELNKEIEVLIDRKDLNKESFNAEEKNQLRLYFGSGGLIKQGATGKGVLYEYYTPDTIIKKMWDMAYHFGYDGGSVLEPSVGIGSFLKYAPKGSTVVGYEINHYAARIAQILYPAAQIHEAGFETIFFAGNIHLKADYSDTRYSLVIGNPPYGDFSGRYAGMGEKKWTTASQYEHYFVLRGLDLLKSGGLLIYIVPSNFLKGSSFTGIAKRIAAKCTGLDRYYLGTGIFKTTDIETDIIVLRRN